MVPRFTLAAFVACAVAAAAGCCAASAPEAPSVLALEDCVGLALAQQQEVHAAVQQVREAEGRLRQTRSPNLPQMDLDTSWTEYQSLPSNKQRIIGEGTTDIYAEVALRQFLYSGGRNQALVDQARLDLLAAHEELRRVRQAVVFQATKAFFSLRQARELLKSQQEAVNQVQSHLDIACESACNNDPPGG